MSASGGLDPATSAMSVVCRGVSKSYVGPAGPVPALRGVDLEVRRGEVMFLVGPSGCGKTTLISIIAGVLHRDGGTCRVLDVDLDALSADDAAAFRRRNVGFVFQSFNLIPTLTVTENVMIPVLLRGMAWAEAAAVAVRALGAVGIGEQSGKLPLQLSGGQQQRTAIARAIVHMPRLVVCDEPTSALDHRTGREVMRLLRDLARDGGITLVVVTHDQRIHEFADRIASLDDGKVIGVDTPASLAGSVS